MDTQEKIDKYLNEGVSGTLIRDLFRPLSGKLTEKESIRQIAVHYLKDTRSLLNILLNKDIDLNKKEVRDELLKQVKNINNALQAIKKIPK